LLSQVKAFASDPSNFKQMMKKQKLAMSLSFINLNWQESPELRNLFNENIKSSFKAKHPESSNE